MTERARLATALEGQSVFERDGDRFVPTAAAVGGSVRIEASGGERRLAMALRVPTIDAVVADETVADVVQEGWLETFERRLEDVGGVTRLEPASPVVRLEAAEREVVVETALPAERPRVAAEDAAAVVNYVQGTFVEGLIPGYAYREPASRLLERAHSSGQQ